MGHPIDLGIKSYNTIQYIMEHQGHPVDLEMT